MHLLCKRSLALILAVLLCVSMLPVSALAEEIMIEIQTAEPETVPEEAPEETAPILKEDISDGEMELEEIDEVSAILGNLEQNLQSRFRVTYLTGKDAVYQTQEVPSGADLNKPEEPVREGYVFLGWYLDEECTIPWDFDSNTVTDDITLYARWGAVSTQLDLTRDTWHITNSPRYFDGNYTYGGNITAGYEMTTEDFHALVQGMTVMDKVNLFFEQRYVWGGSCFGMSSAVVLCKDGSMDIADFPEDNGTRYTTLASADLIRNTTPENVGNIESMLTFYQFRQWVGEVGVASNSHDYPWDATDSNNLRTIISKMRSANAPVLMAILLEDPYSGSLGGHAVVAYDLETTAGGYTFKVYDCSLTGEAYYVVDVSVDNSGTYTAECPEWEYDWGNYIYFSCAVTSAELRAHPILVAPGVATGGTTDYYSVRTNTYTMITNCMDFTITDGSRTAGVSGSSISGDLAVKCTGLANEVGMEPEYIYELPALPAGGTYTIRQNTTGSVKTRVINTHPSTGFFASQEAKHAGTITIGADGSINTLYEEEVDQRLCTALSSSETPWYAVELEGESTGFLVEPDKKEVTVLSETEATVEIRAVSDFNNITLSDVAVGEEEIVIRESVDRDIIVALEEQLLQSSSYGYSVAFDSNKGSDVQTLTNVEEGSLIEKPSDPVREGFVFGGWYADEACTVQWNFEADTVSDDTILYACWLEQTEGHPDPESGLYVQVWDETYTGRAVKPQVKVWDDEKLLTEGEDYTISFRNNVRAADQNAAKAPQAVIRGKGEYRNVKNLAVPFTIHPADLKDLNVSAADSVTEKAGGKLQKLTVSVRTEYIRMSSGNYTVRYYTDEALTREVRGITGAGTYYLTVEAKEGKNITGVTDPIRVEVTGRS